MILIWANFNAQSFIHLKLSMQCSELFFMSVHVCNSSENIFEMEIRFIRLRLGAILKMRVWNEILH